EQLTLARIRLPGERRLDHAAEHDAIAVALELERNDTGGGPEPDPGCRHLPADHERGAEHRVAGERKLVRRREDADARVATLLGRQHEDGLREVQLPGDALHALAREAGAVREHGELIAFERRAREHVRNDVGANVGVVWKHREKPISLCIVRATTTTKPPPPGSSDEGKEERPPIHRRTDGGRYASPLSPLVLAR